MYVTFGIDGVSYAINDRGRIKTLVNPTYIEPYKHDITGEKMVRLRGKELSVAELVLRWHGTPPNQCREKKEGEVAHYLDKDETNTNIANLVWAKKNEKIEKPKQLPAYIKVFVAELRSRGVGKGEILQQVKKQHKLDIEPYQIQNIIASLDKEDYRAAKIQNREATQRPPDNLVPEKQDSESEADDAEDIVSEQEKKAQAYIEKQRDEYRNVLQEKHHNSIRKLADKAGIKYDGKNETVEKLVATRFPIE